MRDQILEKLANEGILLEPDAVGYIMGKDDPIAFCHAAIASMAQHPLVITLEDLRSVRSIPPAAILSEKILEEVRSSSPGPIT